MQWDYRVKEHSHTYILLCSDSYAVSSRREKAEFALNSCDSSNSTNTYMKHERRSGVAGGHIERYRTLHQGSASKIAASNCLGIG